MTLADMGTDSTGPVYSGNAAFWRSSWLFTAVMCFLATFSMQSMRLNMSVAIVCMVNHTALAETMSLHNPLHHQVDRVHQLPDNISYEILQVDGSHAGLDYKTRASTDQTIPGSECVRDGDNQTEVKNEDGHFLWSKAQQGLVLNSYYWGYITCMIPSGWLVNRFQSVRVVGVAAILSSVACLLIPVVASHGPVGVIVLKVFTGCLAGTFFPGVMNLLAKWISPSRVASVGSFAFTGATCGTIVIFIFSGYMCKYGFAGGWPSVFYVNGAFSLTHALVWLFFVKEYPLVSHGNASREYTVVEEQRENLKQNKVPWRSILTSKPFYAVVGCAIAIDFYSTTIILYLPTYFADVMNFKITSNGVLSSLPFAFKSIVQFIGGLFSDLLLRKTSVIVGTSRKICIGTGKILCAVSIIVVGFMNCEQSSIAIVLMVMSLSAVGLMELGTAINPIDIAGQYAGIILSIAISISNTVGLASASITSAITSENPTRESWQIVFIMAASVVLTGLVVHIICASGQLQPWAVRETNNMEVLVDLPLSSARSVDDKSLDEDQSDDL